MGEDSLGWRRSFPQLSSLTRSHATDYPHADTTTTTTDTTRGSGLHSGGSGLWVDRWLMSDLRAGPGYMVTDLQRDTGDPAQRGCSALPAPPAQPPKPASIAGPVRYRAAGGSERGLTLSANHGCASSLTGSWREVYCVGAHDAGTGHRR